jgi:uncharacterized protein (DUF58 family)
MLTKQGVLAVAAGVTSLVVARMFGILELFIIGAGFLVAVAVGLATVWIRRPRVSAQRWVHPSVLVAGDTGRVDISVTHLGAVRSSAFVLVDTIQRPRSGRHVARLSMASLRPRSSTSTGYQLSTSERGLVTLGPLVIETSDTVGVARRRRQLVDVDHVFVAPKSFLLDMPTVGQGVLGEHLLAAARRLGPGDFHGLREYVAGDEPRSIHWKASARSEELMVKEHTIEGLRRCTVVLDAGGSAYVDAESFERAITAAASLVHSADRAGLTTRFVTGDSIDLRGPDVAPNTLRYLAQVELDGAEATRPAFEHDPGEGLGLLVVISGSKASTAVRAAQQLVDPTNVPICVLTDAATQGALDIGARSEREFVERWQSLTGRVDLRPVGAGR